MIVRGHLKAARALLSWTQADLAEAANVSREVITDFDSGKRAPILSNLSAIVRALRDAGVQLGNDGSIRLSSSQ
jgi:predicted transcriptional regulator